MKQFSLNTPGTRSRLHGGSHTRTMLNCETLAQNDWKTKATNLMEISFYGSVLKIVTLPLPLVKPSLLIGWISICILN